MFYKSIRFKMTIVYMVILAVTISSFSAVLYHYVRRSLNESMDTLLQSKAEGIIYAISTYWAAERLGTKRYGAKPEADTKDGAVDFATMAQRWVQARSMDPKLLDIIVKIFNADGALIVSSKNTQGITNVSEETLAAVLQGRSCFDHLTSSFPTKKFLVFRVFIAPAVENNKVEYIVQVASPMTSIQTALNSIKVIIFLLIPVTILATGLMGVFLAGLALHPVDNMINTIHDITAENMKLKIKVPETKDEIQKLAETFNDMLGRLDSAFTTQKHLFEDLSHELKTPLTILKGEFEVVLKKMRSSEEYETILRSSLEEVDKITRLVENLLMLASFESKKILPERKSLDLNLLVQGVANSVKTLAEEKKIGLNVEQHDRITLNADEKQIKRLVLNLLDNAVKYTEPGGKVAVDIRRDGQNAKMTVKDTGIGIPKDEIGRIFDRFYRIDDAKGGHGFGLGLSIVKSIVDSHKGSITVDSRPGAGTTFIVTFPAPIH
ncbi:MAG: ATP-binding protein [Candidatus Omnitrophota bacterium]|nr:ATP-binding protein [Candidatus Omnitrophota bacterium]